MPTAIEGSFMTDSGRFDVFFSHSHRDAEIVAAVALLLEKRLDIRVWLDKWHLVPGGEWQRALARALDEAATCAIFLGATTPAGWFYQEIQAALNRQVREPSFRVIPVLLPNSDKSLVDRFLELRTWVELDRGIEDERALDVLAAGIRGVAPGRPDLGTADLKDPTVGAAMKQLQTIRAFQADLLVADEIALEFQRKILDRMIKLAD
jgi:TIR domain-containing protein